MAEDEGRLDPIGDQLRRRRASAPTQINLGVIGWPVMMLLVQLACLPEAFRRLDWSMLAEIVFAGSGAALILFARRTLALPLMMFFGTFALLKFGMAVCGLESPIRDTLTGMVASGIVGSLAFWISGNREAQRLRPQGGLRWSDGEEIDAPPSRADSEPAGTPLPRVYTPSRAPRRESVSQNRLR